MSLSALRKHHLLTRALPPRTDDEHVFMVANGFCECCYGKLPEHIDELCPLKPIAPPPALTTDDLPPQL